MLLHCIYHIGLLHGTVLYKMVFRSIGDCIILHTIKRNCMVSYVIAWYCILSRGIAWYCMVLYGIAWYFWYSIVVFVVSK